MTIIHNKVDQGTEEWFAVRRGKITGSILPKLISFDKEEGFTIKKGRSKGSVSKEIETILWGLVADDYLHGTENQLSYTTKAMENGKMGEVEARAIYQRRQDFRSEDTFREIGFIESECKRYGMSPDGLVGDNGFIEIKTPEKAGGFLEEVVENGETRLYKEGAIIQIMMGFVVNPKLKWCDFILYNTFLRDNHNYYVRRIERSEEEVEQVKNIIENELLPKLEELKHKYKTIINNK